MGTLVQFPAATRRTEIEAREAELDTFIFWAPLVVVWLGSIARVALALLHREVFGTEATLAFICLIGLPLARAQRGLRTATIARR